MILCRETYIEREKGESINDRNDRGATFSPFFLLILLFIPALLSRFVAKFSFVVKLSAQQQNTICPIC